MYQWLLYIDLKRFFTVNDCGLTLGWVPGHYGTPGNEAADVLARRGVEMNFIGPELWFCHLGKGFIEARSLTIRKILVFFKSTD